MALITSINQVAHNNSTRASRRTGVYRDVISQSTGRVQWRWCGKRPRGPTSVVSSLLPKQTEQLQTLSVTVACGIGDQSRPVD